MAGELIARPVISAEVEVRRASSSCCGALLSGESSAWLCRKCGEPCDRVLAAPEKVVITGG